MNETRFWLLRHAPLRVPPGVILGSGDAPCDTSDGEALARMARRLPRGAVLVESGIARCRQTAEALRAAGAALPPPRVEPALGEQSFGAWQGRRWDDLDPAAAAPFWAAPATARPPGGESFADVVARVGPALGGLATAFPGRDIVAVAHAGSIRAAVAVALDLAPEAALRLDVPPLSLTRLDRIGEGWRVGPVAAPAALDDGRGAMG